MERWVVMNPRKITLPMKRHSSKIMSNLQPCTPAAKSVQYCSGGTIARDACLDHLKVTGTAATNVQYIHSLTVDNLCVLDSANVSGGMIATGNNIFIGDNARVA